MIVKVSHCYNGNNNHTFQLELPNGLRLVIRATEDTWCRADAIRAKDLIVAETGIDRRKIRFQ